MYGNTATFNNSTFSGNTASAGGSGGGFFFSSGSVTFNNSTITGNKSNVNGAGIRNINAVVTLRNTIVANNTTLAGALTDDVSRDALNAGTYIDGGHNLIRNMSIGFAAVTGPGTIMGVDPGLAPLGWYGGTTQTHALLSTSPARGAGYTPGAGATDQRGKPRAASVPTDIGAYAVQVVSAATPSTYIVTNTKDYNIATDAAISGSLRFALAGNLAEKPNVVIFNIPVSDSGYSGGTGVWTITGKTGTKSFTVDRALTIDASTQPGYVAGGKPVISVKGSGLLTNFASVFFITPGVGNVVALNALNITGGKGTRLPTLVSGGGVYVDNGTVAIRNSVISGNSAFFGLGSGVFVNSGIVDIDTSVISANSTGANGGGLFLSNGTVTIRNSLISTNTVLLAGGGVYVDNGHLDIINTTISGNKATSGLSFGAGVYLGDGTDTPVSVNIVNSTIANNTSANMGGGIYNDLGTLTLTNTIVGLNTASSPANGPDISGAVSSSSSHNLIGTTAGSTGLNPALHNYLNVTTAELGLAPLGNYGGPTQTYALMPSSLALDSGGATGLAFDQRGFARVTNGTVDIGAYESQGFLYTITGGGQSTLLNTSFATPIVITVTALDPLLPSIVGTSLSLTFVPAAGGASVAGPQVVSGTLSAARQLTFNFAANTEAGTYSARVSSYASAGFSLTNLPIQVIVTPNAGQSKVYGDVVPLTYALSSSLGTGASALLAGDSLAGMLGLLSENVGTTPFLPGTLSGGGRYLLVLNPSSPLFTITPRSITVAPLPGQSKIYGETDPVFQYGFSGGGLIAGDILSGSLARVAGEDIGSYPFLLGSLANRNYLIGLLTSPEAARFSILGQPIIPDPDVPSDNPVVTDPTFATTSDTTVPWYYIAPKSGPGHAGTIYYARPSSTTGSPGAIEASSSFEVFQSGGN